MNKLLYITNGINGAGGLERVLSVKASYFADKLLYDVTILSLNHSHLNLFYQFSNKIKFVSIEVGGNIYDYIKAYQNGLQTQVDLIQPDVICVCDDGLKAFFIPRLLRTKAPIVYERHVSKEIEMNENFNLFKKLTVHFKWALMKCLASSFTKFIVLTKGNLKEWKSLKNILVIPNPLSFYSSKSSALQNYRIIAVGKQGYQKGYDRLLNAWKLVSENNPDWVLEIYGTILPELKLIELSQKLNIENSVRFFSPQKDIESKYLEASIFVLSSRYEGFGMVLTEAMACGLPCISFDCPHGPADIISNFEDGYLIENGNVAQMANAINELINNEPLRKMMGDNAKKNAKRYLTDRIMMQWMELFNSFKK